MNILCAFNLVRVPNVKLLKLNKLNTRTTGDIHDDNVQIGYSCFFFNF